MKTVLKMFGIFNLSFLLSCCQGAQKPSIIPAIVPQAQKTEVIVKKAAPNIIGAVEPIYLLPMKSAFYARIDTGATTASIDVQDVREFERDGEKWVSFKIVNRRSGEEQQFEKPVVKTVKIKRIEKKEQRHKVMMDISFGGKKSTAEFTLADRQDFKYQALIGRNILTGRYIVDTSLSHTLK